MDNLPTRIGKYDVLDVIGRGGMGVVYKARDPQLDRLVAIKMIIGATPGLLKRFNVEARSMASLQHQNIVTIYDFGDQAGSPYLVMEFLEGKTLDSVITSGTQLSLVNKLRICIDICNGLNYAHERGIIHRDIKPANVMLLNDGGVKIVDFGIARIGDTGISRTEIVGTIYYMSPEQFLDQPLDRRTDIFSTGVVLYRLLTGALPFQSSVEAAVMYQIIHQDPPPLASYVQDNPPELQEIVSRALAKKRDLRYGTGRDFAFDLQAVLEKQKHLEVSRWLKWAEGAIQRMDWAKAEDSLRQVLIIDQHHTQAHQLMGQVQSKIRQQRVMEQVRQLLMQADQVFIQRRYDEALGLVDQGLTLDPKNQDLATLRDSIRGAKFKFAQFGLAIRKAEEAQQIGDLSEAKKAIEDALEIEPYDTSAKALQVSILKQVQEQNRQFQLRALIDSARSFITERKFVEALKVLEKAEEIDPSSVEVLSLVNATKNAKEDQLRKLELEKQAQEIERALNEENYTKASKVAQDALQQFPRDQGLLKLKDLADAQHRRQELKTYARDQFLLANRLLDAGQTLKALSCLDAALRRTPGDTQLESLRKLARERIASKKLTEGKQEVLRNAQDLVTAGEFDRAIELLEHAQREFSPCDQIETLLRSALAKQSYARQAQEAMSAAEEMLRAGNADDAVKFLEHKTLEVPDPRLFDVLEVARRRLEESRAALRVALEQGNRILEHQGTLRAAEYLNSLPMEYRNSNAARSLVEAIQRRSASEKLQQRLDATTDPGIQVRLAEAALRENPKSEEIKRTLALVRSRKEQIDATVERASNLEDSLRFAEAASELGTLRELYPKYPNLEAKIERLNLLEEESRTAKQAPALDRRDTSSHQQQIEPFSATRMIDSAVPTEDPRQNLSQTNAVSEEPLELHWKSPLTRRSLWLLTSVMVLTVIVSLIFLSRITHAPPRSAMILVKVDSSPSDSSVKVDGLVCPSPCQLQLASGSHTAQAERDGYSKVVETIEVGPDKSREFLLTLSRSEPTSSSGVASNPDLHQPNSPAPDPSTKNARPAIISKITPKPNAPAKPPLPLNTDSNPSIAAPAQPAPPTIPSPTLEFAAVPDTIDRGKSTQLRWNIRNADEVSIDGEPVATSGSRIVSPDNTTVYHIFAKGPGGTIRDIATVNVRIPSAPPAVATNVLPPANPPHSTISGADADTKAITTLLNEYQSAFESKDPVRLRRIWPTMSDKEFRSLSTPFKDAQKIQLTLRPAGPPQIQGDRASVSCLQFTQITHDGMVQPLTNSANFLMRRLGSDWIIEKVEYGKPK